MAKSYTLQELAALVAGKVVGDGHGNIPITGVNSIDLAGPGELTFLVDPRQADLLTDCSASACLVPGKIEGLAMAQVVVGDPGLAEAIIHNHILATPFHARGIHESAVVGQDCEISDQVTIGPLVCIGERVRIGDRVVLHPGVIIEDDVVIGDDCILHAGSMVAHDCSLGNRVVLFHGAVIGSDGFGFATDRSTGVHVTKPQVGTVRLDDDVQVGANSCIDRAAFGTTRIRAGVRLDNLVMIGHNVEIGENSIIVAQAGIAGSSKLGRNVILASKAGVADHVTIGDGVRVAAMGGVHNDQPAGVVLGGAPAIDVKTWARASAAFRRLPEMAKEIRRLRNEINKIRSELQLEKIQQEKME